LLVRHPLPASAGQAPPQIAFLLSHGVPLRDLLEAGRIADALGVPADEALLKGGFCDEESFYRALAREAQADFLTHFDLSADVRFPSAIATGVAPLAPSPRGHRFVSAPRGAQIPHLLARRLPHQAVLGVTTPTRLRDAVLSVGAEGVARSAAHELGDTRPRASFRDGLEGRQRAVLAGAGIGLSCLAFAAPAATLGVVGSCLGLLFLFMAAIRLATACEGGEAPPFRPPLPDHALPVYTIVVPLHREAAVAGKLIAALSALDYPVAKLDIKLVVEHDDASTRRALAEMAPERMEIVVAPPGAPRTKPRALNIALPIARGEHIVIYDAEDEPEPRQLRDAVALFARAPPDVVCLQARLAIENANDGWLTRLFAAEYAALFDVVNPGLCALDLPVLLGGTSNHFRTQALRRLGGWDAWNVTEDADLGLRLAREGLRTADLSSTTWEEAPARVGPWLAQRTRWMKGFLQVCITHSRSPRAALRDLGGTRSAAAIAATVGTVVAALTYPLGIAALAILGSDVESWMAQGALAPLPAAIALLVLVLTPIAVLVPALIGLTRRGWLDLAPWLVLMPVYCGLMSLAAWRAVIELIRSPSHWNKTEHGLARTSRRGVLKRASTDPPRLPRAGG
jgi:hypothetical protein